MGVPQRWLRFLVVPLALLAFVVVPASTSAPRVPAVGMFERQCANSPTGIGDCIYEGNLGWTTGNLGQANSLYREGDFVPFRLKLTNLNDGTTYTLRINWDAVEKGLHTYDYLGTYDASENYPGPPQQQVVPCGGIGDVVGPACDNPPSTFPIPEDTRTTFPDLSHPPPSPVGDFSAWGATLVGAAYDPTYDTPISVNTPGTVKRGIALTLTAHGDTAVVAWGGHLASVLDWGTGKTFASGGGTGASFHMRLTSVFEHPDGPTTSGNEDLSINVNAIANPPSSFTTAVDRSSVEVGSAVLDTATLGGRPGAPVSGVVNFFVCGPSSTGPPDCTSGGAPVPPGGAVVLARSRSSRSGVVSVHFVPTAPGSYCFRAEYVPGPAALYSPAVHTNTTTECFNAVETPPQLTIVKRCFPSTDGGHFNLVLDGVTQRENAACGQSVGPLTVTPGTSHTVSETAGTGTSLGDYASSVVGGDCTNNVGATPPSGSITLVNGESATCTITNTRPGQLTGTLVVNKVCDPTTDGGRFDLEIDTIPFADRPCGGSTGEVTVSAGPHTVSESGGTGTSLADYTTAFSTNCSGGSVTVPAGATVTCTITNTRNPIAATLTVTKACVPGSSARFTILINGDQHGTVGCGGSVGPVDVPPGYNTVDETGADASDYNAVLGGDCQPDGTVFVGAGKHATCTITNIHKGQPLPAMLAVQKICVPSNDGGLFTLTIDGQSAADQPCGGRLGPVVVSPGAHRVGEAAGAGTSLSNYTSSIGGDCAADGSVSVAAGETKTCTITNVRAGESTAQITIVKHCTPAGVRARFQLSLDDHVFQSMRCGDSTGPVTTSTGVHSVGEVVTNVTSILFRTIITGDCAPTGTITLTAGQNATCTVTNVRRPLRPGRPPRACYRLTVLQRMVRIGKLVPIVARVHLHGRPVPGVRVFAVAHRVSAVRTTGPNGRVLFLLRLHRPGILSLNIRTPFECPAHPPQKIGVLGVSQPSLTG